MGVLDDIEVRLSEKIDTLSHFKGEHRYKFVVLSLLTGGIASVNVFLVGLSQMYPGHILGIAALLTSSSIAFLGVLDGILRPKEMWVRNAEALNDFYDLRERIRHKRARGNVTPAEEDAFFEEFRRTDKDFHASMAATLSKTPSKTD